MPSSKKLNYISLQEAIKYCNYSQEYLSLRARQGKLKSVKIGRNWVTTKKWVEEYLSKIKKEKFKKPIEKNIKKGRKIKKAPVITLSSSKKKKEPDTLYSVISPKEQFVFTFILTLTLLIIGFSWQDKNVAIVIDSAINNTASTVGQNFNNLSGFFDYKDSSIAEIDPVEVILNSKTGILILTDETENFFKKRTEEAKSAVFNDLSKFNNTRKKVQPIEKLTLFFQNFSIGLSKGINNISNDSSAMSENFNSTRAGIDTAVKIFQNDKKNILLLTASIENISEQSVDVTSNTINIFKDYCWWLVESISATLKNIANGINQMVRSIF